MSREQWEAAAATRTIEIWVLHFFTSILNNPFIQSNRGGINIRALDASKVRYCFNVLLSTPTRFPAQFWPSNLQCAFFCSWRRPSRIRVSRELQLTRLVSWKLPPEKGMILSNRGCCFLSSSVIGLLTHCLLRDRPHLSRWSRANWAFQMYPSRYGLP